jgi:hypothetical protein
MRILHITPQQYVEIRELVDRVRAKAHMRIITEPGGEGIAKLFEIEPKLADEEEQEYIAGMKAILGKDVPLYTTLDLRVVEQ